MAPPTFAPFNPASETWNSYEARFECFLEANDYTGLSSSRKRAHFLNACGPEMFAVALALLAPVPVQTVSWEVLRDKLKSHYEPTPSRIARRFAFRQILQAEGESINHYMASLRTAALNCEFAQLEDSLLEQFVCGVKDLRIQRHLLEKKEITLATAIEEAQACELSSRSTLEIRKSQSAAPATKPNTVHSEEAGSEVIEEEEDEVSRLKTSKGKRITSDKDFAGSPCQGCGEMHPRATCRFRTTICRRCGKKGHLARVCRANLQGTQPNASRRLFQKTPKPSGDCFAVSKSNNAPAVSARQTRVSSNKKIYMTITIEGNPCQMEVDTGSSKSLISWHTLKQVAPNIQKRALQPCQVRLRDYQGNDIPVMGGAKLLVEHKTFTGKLPLIIVRDPLPSLLGLDWFGALGLGITGIHSVRPDNFEDLMAEFADVFNDNLGKYKGSPISLNLDPKVAPVRLKPRRVPFALKPLVDKELDKLIAQGILEPTDHAPWETPIVLPIKPDGSIRICADYKNTVNKALQAHPYPVPVVQHLLHSLGKGSIFAKLDMAQAYQQLPVDSATAAAQTIVTHRGAFKCHRLQFGISVAPGIFQSLMERLLQGLPGVVPYFDDIIISASSQSELKVKLRTVLCRFQTAGLKLKKAKCRLGVPQVEFLGYLIDASGIHPTPSKIAAIKRAPTPGNKTDLQAFLGLLNFYSTFLPHKATVAEPLHRLLDKKSPWRWGPREASSFEAVKSLLSSDAVLVQYSESLPLVLAADASPFGIGAVLSHALPNGTEAPIAFYSRTLSSTERNYGQIDKEALAAVAAVKRFHDYLYGRPFTLVTDHKPLLGILAGNIATPQVLSPRMSRWVEFLAAYSYSLVYCLGKLLTHADALSRCPLPISIYDPSPTSQVLLIESLHLPLSASDIATHSAKDPILRRVLDWVRRGWPPGSVGPEFKPYHVRQHELSVQRGCLLWGNRVVVPAKLQQRVLESLHEGHPGIARMKSLGRSYVWWPNFDQAATLWVAGCQPCQLSRPSAPATPVKEWEMPKSPWSRIHVDFARPFHGQTFLVVVDAYSKWVEIVAMASTTSAALIRALQRLFATHGLPDVIVSDNGPQLASAAFQVFLAGHGIHHARVAPFCPASNGLAERAVRSAKETLSRFTHGDWQEKVALYLLAQHVTPCPSTNRSPAELLMGRRLRTDLDRLHPAYSPEKPPDSTSRHRSFSVGDSVYAQNFGGEPKWLPGTIEQNTGPYSYQIRLPDGRLWHRHLNQIRARLTSHTDISAGRDEPATVPTPNYTPTVPSSNAAPEPNLLEEPGQQSDDEADSGVPDESPGVPLVTQAPPTTQAATPELRRSSRTRRRPAYLADYACSIQRGRGVKSSTYDGRP
ncbi:uncharacterized protein K02A2.6-like [Pantherophis guttatus]|uniref:Gypsy retrotransposon integrase-like protein 1 n=1 Tax=Pantherophis guttatus TaxID=94885 RepID=A0ABM3YSB0_PANGU|nr:uncharacterized protein K02A2.6-like [Pantherophis guttatus]